MQSKRFSRIVIPLIVVLMGVGLWSGCDSILSSMDKTDGFGKVNILMTDAPFPFDLVKEANVQITEIQLVPASIEGESQEDTDENAEEQQESEGDSSSEVEETDENEQDKERGIITLKTTWNTDESTDPQESIGFNLLDLRDGVTAKLVGDAEIPAGAYSQIRLIVAREATLVDKNDQEYSLKIPSGTQTGVKVQLDNFEVSDGSETTFLLDFNLEDSFVARGNVNKPGDINGMIFKPVVHLQSVTDGPPEQSKEAEETDRSGGNGETEG